MLNHAVALHLIMKPEAEAQLVEKLSRYIFEAVKQICGGGTQFQQLDQLRESIVGSISFPNKKNSLDVGGKPHDIEVRIALSLFHKWKRSIADKSIITIESDFGVKREVPSPRTLAEMICLPLEETCRDDGISHDVRFQSSGLICIVTHERSELLRKAGKLPCPHCCHWCKGKKGLWWHQQQKHVVEYSEATAVASSYMNDSAIVPYVPGNMTDTRKVQSVPRIQSKVSCDDPFECIRKGSFSGLMQAVQNGYNPCTDVDRRGASPLMWAAGSGHLQIVKYLVESYSCDPNQPQRGKRSFSGRTALHWAARNGHIAVVKYLLDECSIDLEAATIDGTTAFCWATWQGHLEIMELLFTKGCNIHTTNSFGCNAVLWCAQGKGEVCALQWLKTKNCNLTLLNSNGHGVLHKAAQRNWRLGCEWFFENVILSLNPEASINLVGPDTEGYCPSDLAGMEGYEDLGRWLARAEMNIVLELQYLSPYDKEKLPNWLTAKGGSDLGISTRMSERDQFTWERYGGIRRMRSKWESISSRIR